MVLNKIVLSKKETEELFKKWSSREYFEEKRMAIEATNKMIEKQDKMWDYCIKNKCTIDDLINAHKKTKSPKPKK